MGIAVHPKTGLFRQLHSVTLMAALGVLTCLYYSRSCFEALRH